MIRRPSLTVGIEEEFQVIDPESRELRSHVAEIFAAGKDALGGKLKPELHQPVVEVGTSVCADIAAAKREVINQRASLVRLAREHGLALTGYLQKPVRAEEFAALLEEAVAMIPESALDRSHQ